MTDYVWRHAPMIDSEPSEILEFRTEEGGEEVFQKALFLLEDKRFLFISYMGRKDNAESGVTDLEYFDDLRKALEFYNER